MPDENPLSSVLPDKRIRKRPGEPVRHKVNYLPLAVWEAIAFVQGQYGVPDKLLAQVAQCGKSTLVEKRAKYGWKVRSLPQGFDQLQGEVTPAQPPETAPEAPLSLEKIAEKIMTQIAGELVSGNAEDFDPQAVKRVAILSSIAKTALAYAGHKRETQPHLDEHGFTKPTAEETSAILHKIGKRVNELAAKRADDIN